MSSLQSNLPSLPLWTLPKEVPEKCLKWMFLRFLVLILICLLAFGSYFCYDNPAALAQQFKNDLNLEVKHFSCHYFHHQLQDNKNCQAPQYQPLSSLSLSPNTQMPQVKLSSPIPSPLLRVLTSCYYTHSTHGLTYSSASLEATW